VLGASLGGSRRVRSDPRWQAGWPEVCQQQKASHLSRQWGGGHPFLPPPAISGHHSPWSLSGPGGCVLRRRSRGGAGTAELAPVALVAGRWIMGGAATTWGIEGASASETDEVATAVKAAVCRKGGGQ
jgi:hypothetical protein